MIRMSLSVLAFFATVSLAAAAPEIGKPAPTFSIVDSNGTARALSDYKGRIVILEWTNDGCPYVKKHYGSGNMQEVQKALTAEGAVWLSIISSAPGKQGHVDGKGANALTALHGAAPTAVLLDPTGKVGKLYEAQTTPHMYVIDGKGVLRYMGAIDDQPSTDASKIASARNYVREAFAAVSAGKSPQVTASDPYGCSVKYP